MRILGIDPGATTGWCVYDTDTRRVVARGLYDGHDTVVLQPSGSVANVAVLERLVPHGASYPQVVEAAYVAGRIAGELRPAIQVHELTRAEVRRILQEATSTATASSTSRSVRRPGPRSRRSLSGSAPSRLSTSTIPAPLIRTNWPVP